jgi:hypothetical protein
MAVKQRLQPLVGSRLAPLCGHANERRNHRPLALLARAQRQADTADVACWGSAVMPIRARRASYRRVSLPHVMRGTRGADKNLVEDDWLVESAGGVGVHWRKVVESTAVLAIACSRLVDVRDCIRLRNDHSRPTWSTRRKRSTRGDGGESRAVVFAMPSTRLRFQCGVARAALPARSVQRGRGRAEDRDPRHICRLCNLHEHVGDEHRLDERVAPSAAIASTHVPTLGSQQQRGDCLIL